MSRLRPALLALLCATRVLAQTLNVENFNNPGATGAVILGTSWANQVTRGPDSIIVAGTAKDDNGWGATDQSLNATGMNFVTIFARLDVGNQAPSLVLSFVDQASLKTHQISVPTSLFSTTTITAVQVPIGVWPSTPPPAFNIANIKEWSIGGGTTGLVPFRMTIDHVALSATSALSAPTITTQPADRVIGVGTGTTLTVAATGTPTLRYQWKRLDGAQAGPIAGASSATLTFANTPFSASGTYQVDVTNDVGTTSSRVATLSVLDVQVTHALATASAAGYSPGRTVTTTHTVTYAGNPAPTNLRWQVMLPTGWSYVSDAGAAPETKPTAGTTSLAEWTWTSVPAANTFTFTITYNVGPLVTGAQSLTAQLLLTQGTVSGAILARPDPLIVPAAILPHSADTNLDFALNVNELTRVIQLYNTRRLTTRTGAYQVNAANLEDGFDLDSARAGTDTVTLARYHSADTDRDARLSLIELTRVIELFNTRDGANRTGRYRVQASTEDGYAPAPGP
eukprot:gene34980-45271_t